MKHLGSILIEGDLDEDRWNDLVARHAALAPEEPRRAVNPFTGEEVEFAPDPSKASVLRDGQVLGELRWSDSVVQVRGKSVAVATEVAEMLGGSFQPWKRAAAEELIQGVDDLDWSSLANGCAARFPEELRALLASSTRKREEALAEIHGMLCDQGSINEASGHALPFLLKLLSRHDLPDRDEVGTTVAYIVAGRGSLQAHARTSRERSDLEKILAKQGKSLERELERERRSVEHVRREARDAKDLLIPLLERARGRQHIEEIADEIERALRILKGDELEQEEEELRRRAEERETEIEIRQEHVRRRGRREGLFYVGMLLVVGAVLSIVTRRWVFLIGFGLTAAAILVLAQPWKKKGPD